MSADIGNIKIGQSPSGIRQATPSAPAAPTIPSTVAPSAPITAPKAPSAPAIVVPSTSGGSSRKFIYLTIGAVVLIGITYALVSMIGGPGSTTTPTPSPSESTTPAPTLSGKSLRSYFGNPGATINLQSVVTGKADLTNGLVSVQPAVKQAISIAIQHQGKAASNATFFEDVIGGLPYHLTQSTADDWALLAFGQSEVFDSSGALSSDTDGGTRLVVIVEITDASQVNQGMQAWEADDPAIGNLAATFAPIFGFDTTKKIVTGFSGGMYRQIPVRYWNFPYADRSIDYAIVTASNNKNYLVLAGSRQAAFFAIDQLMQ